MPRRVESSLVVAEDFVDSSNTEWKIGDRAPLARRSVCEAAIQYPHLFLIEFETTPFDAEAEWFQAIVADYERRYQELKAHRDSEAERRAEALRVELKAQDQAQPELERRYATQRKEREEQAKRIREENERRRIENELEFGIY